MKVTIELTISGMCYITPEIKKKKNKFSAEN